MASISITRLIVFIKYNWLQILLIVLSIYDLRIDLRILLDAFTFSALLYTISEHTLSITVLATSPYCIKNVD